MSSSWAATLLDYLIDHGNFFTPAAVKTAGERQGPDMPFIETTVQDVRYGLRGLARRPGFSLVAVATLAGGIGAVTTVFAFTRAVLLRALPYRSPGELVRIYETNPLKNW